VTGAPARTGYFAACGAVIGWSLGVLVPSYGRWPMLFYQPAHPADARWFVARSAGALPIAYYSLLLYGLLFALTGAAAGALAGRRIGESADAPWLGAAWALTAVLVSGAYYTFQLWP